MSLPAGLCILYTSNEMMDEIFLYIAKWMKSNQSVHWIRQHPIHRKPFVPLALLQDPYALKRIHFYYCSDDTALRKMAKIATTVYKRQEDDIIICEMPLVPHKQALAAALAIYADYAENGHANVLVILPFENEFVLTSSLYTFNLFCFHNGRPRRYDMCKEKHH